MSKDATLAEALKLPPKERYELVMELWDSLDDYEVPLSAAWKEELERRIEDCEKNPDDCIPWEVVRDRMLEKLRKS